MNTLLNKSEESKIKSLALEAGELLSYYYTRHVDVIEKDDFSPVTKADLEANDIIVKGIASISSIPIISEENNQNENQDIIQNASLYWIVDPLDGTHSFITKNGYFTVNIALVKNYEPILGFLYSPLDETLYWNDGNGAFIEKDGAVSNLLPNADFSKGYDFLVSYRNLDSKLQDIISKYETKTVTPITSSIKFALIAEGKGDIYPRFKNTSAWDTAAGHAILKAVGGEVVTADKKPLLYNNLANPHFVALASKDIPMLW